jgi:hypothetical protein
LVLSFFLRTVRKNLKLPHASFSSSCRISSNWWSLKSSRIRGHIKILSSTFVSLNQKTLPLKYL